jgi:hypothetical protein
MIDVHYWPTPNGHKITMFLEETGMDYRLVPVDIGKGQQFRPEFLAISPNNRMPAIVDHEPASGRGFARTPGRTNSPELPSSTMRAARCSSDRPRSRFSPKHEE